jgi:hypothetical protein
MLPTLKGRWDVRFLLFMVVGVPVTALYSWLALGTAFPQNGVPWLVLGTLFVVGAILDPVYIFLQSFRWERDWPFAFQLASMIFEFLLVVGLAHFGVLTWLPSNVITDGNTFRTVLYHFLSVLIPAFILLLGPLQIFFVRWRFKAGEFGRL